MRNSLGTEYFKALSNLEERKTSLFASGFSDAWRIEGHSFDKEDIKILSRNKDIAMHIMLPEQNREVLDI